LNHPNSDGSYTNIPTLITRSMRNSRISDAFFHFLFHEGKSRTNKQH